jgi:aquaporin NIP
LLSKAIAKFNTKSVDRKAPISDRHCPLQRNNHFSSPLIQRRENKSLTNFSCLILYQNSCLQQVEMNMKESILKTSIAEAIGTFVLVFLGCGAILVNESSKGAIGHQGIALTFGLVVMIVIFAIGHVSGAHINPAVTITFACTKKFPWQKVIPYLLAQSIGAIIAAFLLKLTLATNGSLGVTTFSGSIAQAFCLEMIMTAVLMFVIMSVATDSRAASQFTALAIGSTIAIDALVGGTITGASMNPARSLGPALVSLNFAHLWLYIVAPIIGALIGGFVYEWAAATTREQLITR